MARYRLRQTGGVAMKVLVTGGAGYIGSHTCVVLLEAGHEVTVIDNLCNSSRASLRRVQELTGRPVQFVLGDIRHASDLERAFVGGIDAVIHFAALKSVGASCERPLAYFDNNVAGTMRLLETMDRVGTRRLVFSSSATVYGTPDSVPVDESSPLRATNPYGRSKLVAEQLIQDWCDANASTSATFLRYFNPVGAHPSGTIGEDPKGVPDNLMPYIAQVAVGRRERLRVFGNDYPTRDGTGIRDYVHVMDLADVHVRAIESETAHSCVEVFNVGTGQGYSVLEVVHAFERAAGRSIPIEAAPRRSGDVAELWADASKCKKALGWEARHGLERMCIDSWRWQSMNPDGYGPGVE
jgi:UDP-glucose 4-epimerase